MLFTTVQAVSVSRRGQIAGAGALAIVIGTGYWLFSRTRVSNDPFVVGQEYMAALLRGDADEVWRLTDHSEFEFNGMSKGDLQKFLTEWLKPRIVRVDGDAYDAYGSGSNGFQTYSWGVATAYGRIPLGVSVAKCDSGLRVVQPLTALLASFVGVKGDHVIAHSPAEVMQCYWQNGIRLAPDLARYHFTKIQQSPSSEPITIEEFALHNRDKLLALHQTTSAGSSSR